MSTLEILVPVTCTRSRAAAPSSALFAAGVATSATVNPNPNAALTAFLIRLLRFVCMTLFPLKDVGKQDIGRNGRHMELRCCRPKSNALEANKGGVEGI
jgi:hypothetical protein